MLRAHAFQYNTPRREIITVLEIENRLSTLRTKLGLKRPFADPQNVLK